jgi:hypothetical protein
MASPADGDDPDLQPESTLGNNDVLAMRLASNRATSR